MTWGHDALQEDLAAFLRATRDRVVWTNMQLGQAGSPRPDVYSVPKSFAKFTPIAYEIKVSVADFRRDVTAGKWQSYLKFASGVTFAVPRGLIGKADLPPGCGLVVRGDDGWSTVKAPTLAKIDTLPRDAWIKLVIDGIARQQVKIEPRHLNPFRAQKLIRKAYGDGIADALSNRDIAVYQLEAQTEKMRAATSEASEETDRIIKSRRERVEGEVRQLRAEFSRLAVAVGLDADAPLHTVEHAVSEAIRRITQDGEVKHLRGVIARLGRDISAAAAPIPFERVAA